MSSVYVRASSTLVFLLAAHSATAGIHIGDPLPGHARQDAGLQIDWWQLHLDEIILTPCGGGSDTHYNIDGYISPTSGLSVPLGNWCNVVLVPDGDFEMNGLTPDDYDLEITLEVGNIDLNQLSNLSIVTTSSTEAAVIELLGQDWWDNQVGPYVGTGQNITIGPNHARHNALVSSMQNASDLVLGPI